MLIKPEITRWTAACRGWEGCLRARSASLCRFRRIRYRASTPGQPSQASPSFHARVVQHECDHLIGRLYPTRMTDLSKLGFTSVLFPELDPASDD